MQPVQPGTEQQQQQEQCEMTFGDDHHKNCLCFELEDETRQEFNEL